MPVSFRYADTGERFITSVIILEESVPRSIMMKTEEAEWKDGFLFLANHPLLDLLNTRLLINDGVQTELLLDAGAVARWFMAAGLVSGAEEKVHMGAWLERGEAERFVEELVTFREALRDAVLRMEKGHAPAATFVDRINRMLEQHGPRLMLNVRKEGVVRARAWTTTEDTLWSRLAEGVVDLLTEVPATRVRQCAACVVHFQDVSRKGTRRWCSMNLCGNRIKVAAYQQRLRAGTEKTTGQAELASD